MDILTANYAPEKHRLELRELTYDERATWGTCLVCRANDGEWCNSAMGIALGSTPTGRPPERGVHLARLNAAPQRVRLVPA